MSSQTNNDGLNQAIHPTGAAILVSSGMKALQVASAGWSLGGLEQHL